MGLASSSTLSLFLLSLASFCISDDQLSPAKPLIFPDDKLISNNGFFALGLFSPTNSSTCFYLGIWYNNDPEHTVVWVANRDNPITTSSSSSTTFAVTKRSEFILSDREGSIYWSTAFATGSTDAAGANATLLNEGNLVLRSSNGTILWQSFDHPTDIVLARMTRQMNYRTRSSTRLVSWKGPKDPSTGDFSLAGDVSSSIQFFVRHGSTISWRSPPLNRMTTINSHQLGDTSSVIVTSVVVNGDEISLTYSILDGSPGLHARLSYSGQYEFRIWNSTTSVPEWTVLEVHPGSGCDHYASCGPFSYCDVTEDVPKCKCLDGFEPNGTSTSAGCVRKEPLKCGEKDHFVTLKDMKMPATPVFVGNRSFDGCAAECLSNCSCTAYAYANLTETISGGDQLRCSLWFDELMDMGKYVLITSDHLYLRLPGSTEEMDKCKAYIPVFILFFLSSVCQSNDQLTQAKPLYPGDTLISAGGDFALGFFSPSRSNNNKSLYIGIWYNQLPLSERAVVWVANRDSPVTTPSAQLAITNSSELVLSDAAGQILWTAANNATTGGAGAVAVLQSSGNLILRAPNGTEIWQSFDHLTDTILPTMKVLIRYKGQPAPRFFAWKGPDDPSTGDISRGVDPDSNLQFFTWNGTVPYCRTAVFNDASLSSSTFQSNTTTSIFSQAFVTSGDELYYMYRISDGSPYARVMLDYTGKLKLLSWNNDTSSWSVISENPSAVCDLYASCGPFGFCDHTAPVPTCRCLDGFELVDGSNSSRGCRRKEELNCGKKTYFVPLPGMKVPDKFTRIWNTSFDQCAAECTANCSCIAYAYANMSKYGRSSVQKKSNLLKILLPIISCVLLLALVALVWICRYRGTQQKKNARKRMMLEYLRTADHHNIEFPFISFEDIVEATNNFSDSKLLGKGGFGKVYKGILEGTMEVAVKRLSKGSGQGTEEFRNEVVLISKLQHKNLVKLLGCCIHEDEKMLVYEYLPNKSLDSFLFDSARKPMLQWPTRFKIIKGIARGIMYLHHDSRLTIIHRDLKASNVLLDKEMSPKISDFGMARIFYSDKLEANTNRVVGTYGYMSHEYAMEGAFSVKSDTYSFGVLLLEIVSGLKISSPQLITDFPNLIVYAWNLWKDGKIEDLVDSSMKDNCSFDEVSRCVHIGLAVCSRQSRLQATHVGSCVHAREQNHSAPSTEATCVFCSQRRQTCTVHRQQGILRKWHEPHGIRRSLDVHWQLLHNETG
ncbi:hypothetical protein QOZ80_4BG0333590 [Eleusine coracana subsp. coracana]|nr:hypothetical protein QOZ80_4BG0333590 [Eleusine coracana subsp. coracana]